jgi:hypothetical protein
MIELFEICLDKIIQMFCYHIYEDMGEFVVCIKCHQQRWKEEED